MSITLLLHRYFVKKKAEQRFDKRRERGYIDRVMGENGLIDSARHPIQVVSRRTGLSPDVIRVWERRYEAVTPSRAGNRRRLYSDADVERLLLLRRATSAGRRIGDVAPLGMDELRALVRADEKAAAAAPESIAGDRGESVASRHLRACLDAVDRLDPTALEGALKQAGNDLSIPVLMESVLMPMMSSIGHRWEMGSLGISHEHMATMVVRTVLDALRSAQSRPFASPSIVVCTPSGQLHEIGALMAAVMAASEGWRVTYLGADLPASDISESCARRNAVAVGLSISYGNTNREAVLDEIRHLRRILPADIALLVGGKASGDMQDAIAAAGAIHVPDLTALRNELSAIKFRSTGL